jgi:hypothetical protein
VLGDEMGRSEGELEGARGELGGAMGKPERSHLQSSSCSLQDRCKAFHSSPLHIAPVVAL